MNTTNFYPVFEADQVLTNKHLNDMFNYLEQQDRLSRMKLIGCGIVCGLEVVVQPAVSITVGNGCGLTSQGFLITFCETVFTHFIPYTTRHFPEDLLFIKQCEDDSSDPKPFYKDEFTDGFFQLITKEAFDNLDADERETSISLHNTTTVDLRKYAVVLFLETEEEDLKNCTTNDCNDKGSQMQFEVKVLLVEKAVLDELEKRGDEEVPAGNPTVTPLLHHVELRRYNVPVQNLKSADEVLQAFANLVDDAKLKSIAEVLNYCFVHYYYLLDNEPVNPFQQVFERFKTLRDDILQNHPVLIQYFYDFIDDVLKAYYEFKHKVFEVNSACCGNEMKFPLHLSLGEATVSTSASAVNKYRQFFMYSPLFNQGESRLAEVRLLFARLKLLVSQADFTQLSDFEKKEVKITPSRYGFVYLSDHCIPYHYKVAEAGKPLYRHWNYDKTRRGNERFNLGYNAFQYSNADNVLHPLLYDIERFDFFRIEGHIGKSILPAISLVKTIQQQNNLPFDTVALSADYIGALVRGEEPKCIIEDLESNYRVLIAAFICKVHNAFCFAAKLPFALPDRFVRFTAATLSRVTAEDTTAIKEALAFNPAVLEKLDHPFAATLVHEFQAVKQYTKGDTLSRLCNPPANRIGSAYIAMKGKFVNPVTINTDQPVTIVQYHAFELIDAIESVLELVMNHELSDLGVAELKSRYDRFEKEVRVLSLFAISLLQTLEKADNNELNELATDLYLDLLVFTLEMLLHLCFTEQMEALKSEYERRMAAFRLAKNFSYYFKTHGGIEHKAGVPRGGTFILVYHEERRNRFIDRSSLFINKDLGNLILANFRDLLKPDVPLDTMTYQTKLLQTSVLYKDPDLYLRFKDVLSKYLDECKDLPDDKRDELTGIINEEPPRPRFELKDGMVIADFYIPYICCSDCPPVAYILPPNPVPDLISISQSDPVCDDDNKHFTVTLTVTGGTPPYSFFINNVALPNNNISIESGAADTTVVVVDNAGERATAIIKTHQCSTPCNLPCNGAAESCAYALWVARPEEEGKLLHEVKNVTFILTDENGTDFPLDVTQTLQGILNGDDNVITRSNFDAAFEQVAKALNEVVPAQFITPGRPMFTYKGDELQVMRIERFSCHQVSLQLELSNVTIREKPFVLLVEFNGERGTTIRDLRRDLVVEIPKFDCSFIDKCNNDATTKSCNEELRISGVNSEVVFTNDNPSYQFRTEETFDAYFWYFEDGVPLYSDKEKTDPVFFAGRANSNMVMVRVIGIKKDNGCFALFQKQIPVQ